MPIVVEVKGPLDLVYVPGWVSHVELAWEEPTLARFLNRLSSFSRLIMFDKRGTGLSDRVSEDKLLTLEERMNDLRAVMDAVGLERAAVFGVSEGGNLCALFAATYPDRTAALVMFGAFAKRTWSPDYPWAPTAEQRQQEYRFVEREWGNMMDLSHYVPSKIGDEAFSSRLATYLRRAASPGAAVALLRMNTQIDIRAVLPTIRVPTLVIHRTGDRDVRVEEGRWLAERVPQARYKDLILEMVYFDAAPSREVLDEALSIAKKAVSFDDRDAFCHLAVARVHLARREYQEALASCRTSLSLNPNYAQAHCAMGDALSYAGRGEEAIQEFEESIRLSPQGPWRWAFLSYEALARIFLKQYGKAVASARAALRIPNCQYWANVHLLAALGHLGRKDESREALAEMLRRKPGFSCRYAEDHLFYLESREQVEHYLAGLRKAGVTG